MLNRTILTLFLCVSFLGFSLNSFGQELDHVQGEILIKLQPDHQQHVRNWIGSKNKLNGISTGIEYHKLISQPMDIHAIRFDFSVIDEHEFLSTIQRDPAVQAAQFNHFVALRTTIPDDPQFDQQWQYINTVANPDADLDMELAWDVAIGGITADGDTIVACVIDDGINLNHPDMVANLWKNHAEIPNNGIDDDNNGYVDDYQGWDTSSDSDAVGDGGGHGTPVAGIVGAKGNNGVGVAGVNWDVKLMIVQGGTGVESEVLEAYSYPLVARQRYNASNGAEGAFVVSTNASWGINEGQPADAPLWCAMYDTLGVHGILNCGATANANFDIDAVGDLPTACASDYLISVTNMDWNDVKVNQAGYGLETVDLGAFGEDTWTTTFNGYGGFGGTSGATPHVTGTIALMYSAPCPLLSSLAKTDPEAAAALVRDYILTTVDPNTSLDGITTTGGRLNVANAMNELMENCGPCPPPSRLSADSILDVTASLDWNTNDSTLFNHVLLRPQGTMDWDTLENLTAPYSLENLTACTEYEFQVMGFCANDTSYSTVFPFMTDGCCENPTEFILGTVDSTTMEVSWTSVLAALSYNVRVSSDGGSTWSENNTTDLSFQFTGLMGCTDYEVQVQIVCDGNMVDYSESIFFTTKGCGACTDFVYCQPDEEDTSDEWIDSIAIGTLINVSGNDDSYGDYTAGPTAEFARYSTVDVLLEPGYSGNNFNERWRVYIDYNQNGSFTDTGEQVFSGNGQGDVTGDFVVPEFALLGNTRMRIAMAFNSSPSSCNLNSNFGEVEDYCITIIDGIPPCGIPENLQANNITVSSADLSWGSVTDAAGYLLRYKITSEPTWTEVSVTGLNYGLTNLADDTNYEFQVNSTCTTGSIGDFSASKTFTTEMAVSVDGLENLEKWNAYPNPFSGSLTVDFSFSNLQPVLRLELYDQLGRNLQQQVLQNIPSGQQQVLLQTENLAEGIYFLRVSDAEGNSSSKRIVKIK